MIYTGATWWKLRDLFVFEDICKLGVFEGNRTRGSGDCRYGFGGSVVGDVGIKVNRGGEGFLVASDISNCEKKEFIAL